MIHLQGIIMPMTTSRVKEQVCLPKASSMFMVLIASRYLIECLHDYHYVFKPIALRLRFLSSSLCFEFRNVILDHLTTLQPLAIRLCLRIYGEGLFLALQK